MQACKITAHTLLTYYVYRKKEEKEVGEGLLGLHLTSTEIKHVHHKDSVAL